LPVGLRGDQQQFVNCKSDSKVAEYGSLGIPALFSAALPYVQIDLPRSFVPTNDAIRVETPDRRCSIAVSPREAKQCNGTQGADAAPKRRCTPIVGNQARRTMRSSDSNQDRLSHPAGSESRRQIDPHDHIELESARKARKNGPQQALTERCLLMARSFKTEAWKTVRRARQSKRT
jgi:hypothetical protein